MVLPDGEPLFAASYAGRNAAVSEIMVQMSANLDTYGWRLFCTLVKLAQLQTLNVDYKTLQSRGQIDIGPLGHVTVEVPIKSLLSEGSSRYKDAKKALENLMKNPVFLERPKLDRSGNPVLGEDGKPEYALLGFQWINNCNVNIKPGMAIIEVNRNTWEAFLDFTKGLRSVDIELAPKLRSVAGRIFLLMTNQTVHSESISELRRYFAMDMIDPKTGEYEIYPSTHNFIKRVIEPAIEELNEKTPYVYSFEPKAALSAAVNRGRRGKKAFTSIQFSKARKDGLPEGKSKKLPVVTKGIASLKPETQKYLIEMFGFTVKGLENNADLFRVCSRVGLDTGFLRVITPDAIRAQNPQGFVIASLKTVLKEKHGVQFSPEGKLLLDDKGEPVIIKKVN